MKTVKIVSFICLFFQLSSCKGQTEEGIITYPKEKSMNTERFDVDSYKKYQASEKLKGELGNPSRQMDTLSNGTTIEKFSSMSSSEGLNYYINIIPAPPKLFRVYKEFYATGVIKEEGSFFIGQYDVPIGVSKEYDEQGYLKREIDYRSYDKEVAIKFNGLLELLQKEPILSYLKDNEEEMFYWGLFREQVKLEDVTLDSILKYLKSEDCNGNILNANSDSDRRSISISLKNYTWRVTKDMYPLGFFDYVFDANTGKLIDRSYREERRP